MNVFLTLAKAFTAPENPLPKGAPNAEPPFEVDTGPPFVGAPPSPQIEGSVQKEVIANEPKPQAEILDLLDAILGIGQSDENLPHPLRANGTESLEARLAVRIGESKKDLDLEGIKSLLAGIGVQLPTEFRPQDLRELRHEIAQKIVSDDLPRNLRGLLFGLLTHDSLKIEAPIESDQQAAVVLVNDGAETEVKESQVTVEPVSSPTPIAPETEATTRTGELVLPQRETELKAVKAAPERLGGGDSESAVRVSRTAYHPNNESSRPERFTPPIGIFVQSESGPKADLEGDKIAASLAEASNGSVTDRQFGSESAQTKDASLQLSHLMRDLRVQGIRVSGHEPTKDLSTKDAGTEEQQQPTAPEFDPLAPFAKKELKQAGAQIVTDEETAAPTEQMEEWLSIEPSKDKGLLPMPRQGKDKEPVAPESNTEIHAIDERTKEAATKVIEAGDDPMTKKEVTDKKPTEEKGKSADAPRAEIVTEETGTSRLVTPSNHASATAVERTVTPRPMANAVREHATAIQQTVLDTMRELIADRGHGRTVVRLSPEDLGTVTIEVRSQGQNIEAKVTASDDRVRHMLSHQRNELVQGIESRGLNLDSFSVGKETAHDNHGFGRGHGQGHNHTTRQEFARAAQLAATNTALAQERQARPTRFVRSVGLDTLA